jgi:hypothetical protein
VFRINICAENIAHRKAAKGYLLKKWCHKSFCQIPILYDFGFSMVQQNGDLVNAIMDKGIGVYLYGF